MIKREKIKEAVKLLKTGGVGVLPTDTLYGLVGRAEDKTAVARIKKLKKRSAGKPFIILIASLQDLAKFKIKLSKKEQEILASLWPGPVSVILPTPSRLCEARGTLAFRLPKNKLLNEIIKKTGPLVAPSANPEGEASAETIAEVKKYFPVKSLRSHGASPNTNIDFVVSAGKRLRGQPSTLIKINNNGKIEILRYGKYKLRRI